MGRIKSTMVKKAARQFIEKEKAIFNENFEHNKKLLSDNLPSKPIRNKVAGYISRMIKMEKQEKQRREKRERKLQELALQSENKE